MKRIMLLALMMLIPAFMQAQENGLVNLRIEARFDYMQEMRQGETVNDNSGFKGR